MNLRLSMKRMWHSLRREPERRWRPEQLCRRPLLELLEDRTVPATITWWNRGITSGIGNDYFNDVFGANANLARSVVDNAILSWSRLIAHFNQPGGGNTLTLTITMNTNIRNNAASTSMTNVTGCNSLGLQCWPTEAAISINSGTDGRGAGWFLDATPFDQRYFEGPIGNAFVGNAQSIIDPVSGQERNPAMGQADLLTVVTHEVGHSLGINSDPRGRLGMFSTNTGVVDRSSCGTSGCVGRYWAFVGQSGYSHLLTSFDSGNGGQDLGSPAHSAAGESLSFGGRSYFGAVDVMNPYFNFSQRRLVPTSMLQVLHEAYNYDITRPEEAIGTFYAILSPSSGELLIRGGTGATTINVLNLSGTYLVQITADPVPGTDLPRNLSSLFQVSSVRSITINPGDGQDTINLEDTVRQEPVTIHLGRGTNTVNISPFAKNLDHIQGAVYIYGSGTYTNLNINDQSNGAISRTFGIGPNTVAFSGGAPIIYSIPTGALQINGGFRSNTFTVLDTAPGVTTIVNTGGADSMAYVRATSSALNVSMLGARTTVRVGSDSNTLDGIHSPVTVFGNNFNGHLSLLDFGTTLAKTYTVTSTTVTRSGSPAITYVSLPSMSLDGGSGANTINVQSTAANVATRLSPGPGDNVVNVDATTGSLLLNLQRGANTVNVGGGRPGHALDAIQGVVSVFGDGPTGVLKLWDDFSGSNNTYTITSARVSRNGMANVNYYDSVRSLVLDTGLGSNTILARESHYATPVTISGGSGDNTLVGSDSANAWSITGTNAGTLTGTAYGSSVSFTSVPNLTGGAGDDVFAFANGASLGGRVDGQGGNNTLDMSASAANLTFAIALQNGGIVSNVTRFIRVQNLIGSAGDNVFSFDVRTSMTGTIDGGSGGNNTLDYSSGWAANVLVNLQTGQAYGVGGGISHIQNVKGANGGGAAGRYNILVGNGGNVLTGGNGRRNLLIAGASASTLLGGDDDDILIGGTTAYDSELDMASLKAVMDYWAGTDGYDVRVDKLQRGDGVPLLDPTTVFGNGGGNTLTGHSGSSTERNLFFGNLALDTYDWDPSSETFIPV